MKTKRASGPRIFSLWEVSAVHGRPEMCLTAQHGVAVPENEARDWLAQQNTGAVRSPQPWFFARQCNAAGEPCGNALIEFGPAPGTIVEVELAH